MDGVSQMDGLAGEIERLRGELELAGERDKEHEKTRRAMLYLLEDNNEYAQGLLKSKRDWEATFDSILDPIFIHDTELRVLKCNKAYQAAAAMPFTEIIGRRYYEVFPKMDGPFKRCLEAMGGEGGHAGADDVAVLELDRVYKVRFYFIESSGQPAVSIHVLEDITEEKRAADKERALYELSREMSYLDLDLRLNKICASVVALGHCMACVGLVDDAGLLTPAAHAGFEDGFVSSVISACEEGSRPWARALASGSPEVLSRLAANEAAAAWRDEAALRGYGSMAFFPIAEGGRPLALLCVCSARDEFPEKDAQFLQAFAGHVAIYIRNARLFNEVKEASERMKEEMEISKHLLMIAFATAHTTEMDKLMGHVVESLFTIMEADCCLAYLWDRQAGLLKPLAHKGLAPEEAPLFRVSQLKPDLSFIRRSFEEGEPVLAGLDKGPEQEAFAWAGSFDTVVIIPLARKEEWLGALVCLYSGNDPRYASGLSERDRQVLGGISYQVATALDEARLYQESIYRALDLSKKIETIQIMHEIDKSILSTLETREILEIAARMISKAVACDRATVALVDKARDALVYEAGFGMDMPKGALVPLPETSARDVIRTGRPEFVPDLEGTARLPFEEHLYRQGFLSHLRVPITVRGDVAGVLSIGSRRKAAFTPEDLSTIEKLASQIGVALEKARLVSDLSELFLGVVKTLSAAIDAKSPWTMGHSERVTGYAIEIGRLMRLPEADLKELELAGLLHDIGKLGTYEAILDKPGRLTDEELAVIRKHPGKGAEILSPIRQMQRILPAIRHHHESFDGRGYPDGLKGGQIPLMARILAVADTVDAMSADRPYRKGKPMDEIVAELKRCSATQFDPEVVGLYLKSMGQRPAG